MRTLFILPAFVALLLPLACEHTRQPAAIAFRADRFDDAEWSDPVNLGPVVNSSATDANASLSSDEHTMYFVSNRAGGFGDVDIWYSERRCIGCPWETPVNIGAPINTATGDGSPTLSENGDMLFFFSARPGGAGSFDLYVSHRTQDGWGEPVNLGPDVNTAAAEQGSYYVRDGGDGQAVLYFNRVTPTAGTDIYTVALSSDGVPLGPATPVAELNSAVADQKVTVRPDGHELLISSNRPGGLGGFDLWRSTRQSVQDPWSTPAHLDAPLNTPTIDSQPHLTRNGQTLIFTSDRAGGSGVNDLWMATRRL